MSSTYFLFLVCQIIPTIEYGTSSTNASLNTNETVTYTCNTGFELTGAAQLTCLSSGMLTPDPPNCIRGLKVFCILEQLSTVCKNVVGKNKAKKLCKMI